MPKDNYFKVVFTILKELSEAKKKGGKPSISAKELGISDEYRAEILKDLSEEGYIRGFTQRKTVTGREIFSEDDLRITMSGEEYLDDNKMMKKIVAFLKDMKDITPGA